jgi:predicted dehydrogenase
VHKVERHYVDRTSESPSNGMKIAIIGCGYVAESYAKTLCNYPELELIGAYDRNACNLQTFCRRWSIPGYQSFEHLADDQSLELVLNLTNPRNHYEITQQCIRAGKHVYSEKPLAMDAAAARELVDQARQKNLYLASAPCSMLGETAQTVWKALRNGAIGRVRLVYANFDDGMIAPKLSPWLWTNESGIPWPAKDEFEVGCTYEHAGYFLTWLAAFFGPATRVTSFASCLIKDKGIAVDAMAPDFTVGCIEYTSGVVARVTCGLVAPRDKSLTIIGDGGILSVANMRNDVCPVFVRLMPAKRWQEAIERHVNRLRRWFPGRETEWHIWRQYPMVRKPPQRLLGGDKNVDFCRGPAEMADAIRHKRPCRLSAELGWHIAELIERLQFPEKFDRERELVSSFDPIQPLPASR